MSGYEDQAVGGPTAAAAAIARLLGITERQLYYHARNGTVPKPIGGRFDLVGCVQGYIRMLKDKGSEEGSQTEWKRRILQAKARKAEREADLFDDLVIRREAVEAAWIAILTNVRARLLALPNVAAHRVEVAKDLPAIVAILTEAIHECLAELGATPAYATGPGLEGPLGAGDSGDDGDEDADAAAEADGVGVG